MAKKSLKERLRDKQTELKSKGSGGNIVFLKDGDKIRARILNMGEDEEFVKEVTQFYLGSEIKGVISPVTFDKPCAIFDKYKELSQSSDEEDKKMAKKFNIRKRYIAYCLVYDDLRGKQVNEDSPKFVMLTSSMYQSIIESYLDEDDWGDPTRTDGEGYDFKFGRTGSGKTDTEYTVATCPKSKCPAEFAKKVYDLDKVVMDIVPSYEETEAYLAKFLGSDLEEEEEEERKPRTKRSSASRKRRRRNTEDV